MNKTIKIYCEGQKGSHDFDILAKITSGLNVHIQPIGGIRGADTTIEEYENAAQNAGHYLFFRDRDFDVAVSDEPCLTVDNCTYYSYRTTIENYLFNHLCFYEFLKEKKLTQKYKIKSSGAVQDLFSKAAQKIAYYQALRHTIAQLRLPTDLGSTWLRQGSGTLPEPKILENQPLCRQKALEKLNEAKTEAEICSKNEFDEILNSFICRFEADGFYENSDFLIWFQGKDFAKSLGWLLPQFPMKNYYRFAKRRFDYLQFEDLLAFRHIVQSHF